MLVVTDVVNELEMLLQMNVVQIDMIEVKTISESMIFAIS